MNIALLQATNEQLWIAVLNNIINAIPHPTFCK